MIPVLRQRRAVADQSGLGARGRFANLAGALEVVTGGARLMEGGRVVLVDDLMTTGASLTEAARALSAVHLPFIQARSEGTAENGTPERRFVQAAAAVVACSPSSFEINRN